MELNKQETAAVLAGLRLLEDWRTGRELQSQETYDMIVDIMGDEHLPDVDALYERLNTAPDPADLEWAFDVTMRLAREGAQGVLQENAVGLVHLALHDSGLWTYHQGGE